MDQLHRFPKLMVILASILTLTLVSYIDYLTGYELLFFVFYFVPVGLCAWHLGRLATLSMAALSGAGWFAVDLLSAHRYSNEWFRYWNSFTCFLAFAILGLVLRHLRQSREEELKARLELENSLAELRASTEAIRSLQTQLQVVCAWTQRIRVEGKWVALDEFLMNKLNVRVSHGISPEALDEIKTQLDRNSPPGA